MKAPSDLYRKSNEELIEDIIRISNELASANEQIKRTKVRKVSIEKQLKERKKELRAEHKLSVIINIPALSLPEMLEAIVTIIPDAWQFPKYTSARIILEGTEYKTQNFRTSKWKLTEFIVVNNSILGSIEVYYSDENPNLKLAFLKEEKELLRILAERISNVIKRIKLAEEASEQNYLNLTINETIPFGMNIIDQSGKILFANKNMKLLFDEDIVGKICWETIRTNKVQCPNCPLKNAFKIGDTKICESSGMIDNRIFEISHTNITYHNQKAILGIFQDITERKLNEDENFKIKNRLQSVFNNMQEAYFQADINGNFTFVNPAAVKMYGYQEDELLGKPSTGLFHNIEDRKVLIESLHKKGKLTDFITRGIGKNGMLFWVSMNVQNIYDKDGTFLGTEGVVRNISEKIKQEQELKISARKFELMLETLPIAVFLTSNFHTMIDYINPTFTHFFGYDMKDVPTMTNGLSWHIQMKTTDTKSQRN